MLEIILVGMLAAIAIVMVVHTVEESLRAFESRTLDRSHGPAFDGEPSWRMVKPAEDAGAADEEREAA